MNGLDHRLDLQAKRPGTLLDTGLMGMIFMGVTAKRGFMQQRGSRSAATFISTAVQRVQDVT